MPIGYTLRSASADQQVPIPGAGHDYIHTLTYPSGRVLSYQVGGAELPLQAADTTTTYAASASYTPQGALAALALGRNINLTQSYSSRLQPSTIQAVSASGTDLLDLAYDFGLGTADNGDVKAIVNNRDSTRTQYFAYDALNRIVLANTQASTGPNAWGQAFGYDPWGNLTQITVTQGSAPALSVSVNANNRISSSGYSYDADGEALTDSVNTYTWNAEGKTATVANSLHGSERYTYDGQGQRVMKKTAAKLYWYGTDGNVLSESDLSGNITEEYIFFGGKRIARVDAQGNVDYYLPDALGSSRVVTDSSGNVLDDCDFLPFGDEQCIKSSSGNNYQFTGKERDSESGNDNFGARYYENGLGRFLSPDPLDPTKLTGGAFTAYLANPQHWDRYAYTLDNPTTDTDPTGLDACDSDNGACAATVPRQDNKQQMEKNQQARAQQQKGSETVGNTTVGALSKTMSNEDRSLSGGASGQLVKGKTALANAIINGAKLPHPPKVAPATGTPTSQDAQIMQAAYTNRMNGGADPVNGSVYYGTTHNPNVQWRPAGNGLPGAAGRETVYQKFGPYNDSISPLRTWIVIYNNPGQP